MLYFVDLVDFLVLETLSLSINNKPEYSFFLISAPAQMSLMCVWGLISVCRSKTFYAKGRSMLLLL